MLGCPRVDILCYHDKTRVSFPGIALALENLPNLLKDVLSTQEPVRREFATALNLVIGLKPTLVEIKVCDGRDSRALQIRGEKVEIFDLEGTTTPETSFQVQRQAGSLITRLGTEAPEYFQIFRRFRYCPIQLSINSKTLSEGRGWGDCYGNKVHLSRSFLSLARSLPESQHVVELRVKRGPEHDGLRLSKSLAHSTALLQHDPLPTEAIVQEGIYYLALGICASPNRASTATFVLWGESLQVYPVKLSLPGVELLISAAGLDLDLSGERLLDNSRFQSRWDEAKSYYELLVLALKQAYPKASENRLIAYAYLDSQHEWQTYLRRLYKEKMAIAPSDRRS